MAPRQYLTDKEIYDFIEDLDKNDDDNIDYWKLERKLNQVHKEIAPKPQPHNLHHGARGDKARHEFLRGVIGTREDKIPRVDFEKSVREWQIPSMGQDQKQAKDEDDYLKQMSIWRRVRAYWAVEGPQILFMAFVVLTQLAFGIWQLVKYITAPQYRPAFGWGAVVAKTSAGVLYPTFFFLILSMSRWFSTFSRRFYFISRFINWDLSQSFHIKMSIVALCFATLHAIGHLTGSFIFGSQPGRQESVGKVIGEENSGLTALISFYLLALMSIPQIRKWSYEVFQLGHLLMFPIIALMMLHGTLGLLQFPMFGYWLAFPTLLVICERLWRLFMGFRHLDADIEHLDEETVAITAKIPALRFWPYKAGQYVFVQVPQISFFQWHPFTVSTCFGNTMYVHIKADGDWTNKLRDIAKGGGKTTIKIGVDGPFGAPAQQFYDFEYSIVFGAGIGVTPFSGILTNLQVHELERTKSQERNTRNGRPASPFLYEGHRRVDFHWMVRDKNNLLWFSDLLNEVSRAGNQDRSHLDIRIETHVTQKRKAISTHVFRWLLEKYLTDDHPYSPLTGLLNPTRFGRPDLATIMNDHYEDRRKVLSARQNLEKDRESGSDDDDEIKVGIFFCGAPVIGLQLADRCSAMTARGRQEGREIEYYFMMEVFG
ncbi:FAD-binding domain-domain-containing protein [Clohesyomyces aquaticus]|uniref:FAD-binding domain-domain-containing protein n=1 Tax=Clohesyomyces aquaticus TaxID=1231657 RepID=A0A1Y1YTR7_9PLEO|nr:FAD-binding domain-domain-containing protein [Clohesyomyces aquaticus]